MILIFIYDEDPNLEDIRIFKVIYMLLWNKFEFENQHTNRNTIIDVRDNLNYLTKK